LVERVPAYARLGRRPPTEADANYYAHVHVSNHARDQ
jgi:hypothetical protein